MTLELAGDDTQAAERYFPDAVRTTFDLYDDVPIEYLPVSNDGYGYSTQRNYDSHVALLCPASDRETFLPEDSTVLEVGPGIGNYSGPLIETGHRVIALDISGMQLQQLRNRFEGQGFPADRLTTIEADVLDIPLPDESVDSVVCFGGPVSYVFNGAPRAVSEMLRVLRPGGPLLVSVMTPGWIRAWNDTLVEKAGQAGYDEMVRTGDVFHEAWRSVGHCFRTYTPESLDRLLSQCGATVIDIYASYATGVADDVPTDEYRRVCRKPEVMQNTTGYLIAVARKPVGEVASA